MSNDDNYFSDADGLSSSSPRLKNANVHRYSSTATLHNLEISILHKYVYYIYPHMPTLALALDLNVYICTRVQIYGYNSRNEKN